jgi:hypothetical protein
MKRLLTLAPIAALLAACEDAGNAGGDNLLTCGSLVLIVDHRHRDHPRTTEEVAGSARSEPAVS